MSLVGLALLGKQNNLLLLHRLDGGPQHGLGLQLVVHSSLDLFQERLAEPRTDPFLGLLGIIDAYAVWGLVTNTNLKVVAVFDSDAELEPRDALVKDLLDKFHGLYVDFVSNPFTELPDPYSDSDASEPGDPAPPQRSAFLQRTEHLVRSLAPGIVPGQWDGSVAY